METLDLLGVSDCGDVKPGPENDITENRQTARRLRIEAEGGVRCCVEESQPIVPSLADGIVQASGPAAPRNAR
jgi:hypothetical protein